MKLKIFLALVSWLCLIQATFAAPESSPSPTVSDKAERLDAAPDAAELARILKDFLAGASRNDLAAHGRFWADDLIYTSSSGRRLGKADIMKEVREEGPPKPGDEETVFSAEDIQIHQYGTTAIVAFRLVGTTKKKDKVEVANYLNTGTFLKRSGEWRAIAWQATVLPGEKPK
jgi:ketosteroid isomerase-like protein